MDNNNYTIYNENSLFDYTSIDYIDDALKFLKNPNSFRTFDKGLIELLKRKGYSKNLNDIYEMSDYLISKLKKINSSIERETVISWFKGEHSPKIEAGSRPKIYQICFALELSYKETVWFFQHVYYDRAFNCHTINEAVFYYAFLNGLNYSQALQIINSIEKDSSIPHNNNIIEANYTQFVQNRISECESIDELKEFLISNKESFKAWNMSALKTLNHLINLLIGSPESKIKIDNLKRTLTRKINSNKNIQKQLSIDLNIYENCGLIMKEILYDSQSQNTYDSAAEFIMDTINKKNIRKNTFILERILSTSSGMKKNTKIPYIVRNNFPSKKTMSDILSEKKISISKSYDAIRKMIILLDFYCFWVNIKLNIGYTDLTKEELIKTYIEEANDCLYKCGYEELYAGNPYDWIFLCSAYSDNPLEYFRSYIGELLGDDDF